MDLVSIVAVQFFVMRRGVVCSIVLQAKEGATTVQLFAARKGKGIVAGSKVRCDPPPQRELPLTRCTAGQGRVARGWSQRLHR